ncbi:MAG: DUF3524 domain-containing protein [Bacteroidia bacterium]|nr:DUF3524 domain-containing protein [Bacteroidia bacterium]
MRILIVEPFYAGSHKSWADELKKFSKHTIEILSLPGVHWKWRMHGAAVTLSRQTNELDFKPDLILCTDIMDIAVYKALLKASLFAVPVLTYFHENQFNYPLSSNDTDRIKDRDNHYGFINYTSCLASDHILFNSHYNMNSFITSIEKLLPRFPDFNETVNIELIKRKSGVLPLGIDLSKLKKDREVSKENRATLLWNHRWEHDKNPEAFFAALSELKDRGIEFKLIMLGKDYSGSPVLFEEVKEIFKDEILHYGFAESRELYMELLYKSDILPVTSMHDFFGVSVVEAMYCNVIPLLPKRLAYPEHIPTEFHPAFFYEDDEEFVNKLQRMIMNVKVLRNQKTRKFIEHYDWSVQINQYDKTFETLIV